MARYTVHVKIKHDHLGDGPSGLVVTMRGDKKILQDVENYALHYEEMSKRLATAEAERDRLKDENDRLRKTLEEIRDDRSFGDNAAPLLRSIAKLELIRIAKTALREVDGGKD